MTAWLVRGVVMALVHFIARTLLAFGIASSPTSGSILRPLTLVVVILVAVVWGGIDGINDRRANPDPDNSSDFTITWLKAAVVAGLLAGLVTWLFSKLFNVVVTSNSLLFELLSGAAFTILLIFIPAVLAVSLGRLLAGRDARKNDTDDEYDDSRSVTREREHAHAAASESGAVTGYTPVQTDDDDYYSQSDQSDRSDYDYDRQSHSDSDTEVFEPVRNDSTTSDTRSAESGPNFSKQTESRDTWQEPR